jgi:hypothetical protein
MSNKANTINLEPRARRAVKAAGGATVKYLGRDYELVDPEVVD